MRVTGLLFSCHSKFRRKGRCDLEQERKLHFGSQTKNWYSEKKVLEQVADRITVDGYNQ